MKFNKNLLSFLIISGLLIGCGSGGNNNVSLISSTTDDDLNITTVNNDVNTSVLDNNESYKNGVAELGRLRDATVEIYEIGENNLTKVDLQFTSSGNNLDEIGDFRVSLDKINPNKYYLIKVLGGYDKDFNDDGVLENLGDNYERNDGIIRAIIKGQDIIDLPLVRVTYATEAVYEGVETHLYEQNLSDYMNDVSKNITGDVNGNGEIDYKDVLVYNPVEDKNFLNNALKVKSFYRSNGQIASNDYFLLPALYKAGYKGYSDLLLNNFQLYDKYSESDVGFFLGVDSNYLYNIINNNDLRITDKNNFNTVGSYENVGEPCTLDVNNKKLYCKYIDGSKYLDTDGDGTDDKEIFYWLFKTYDLSNPYMPKEDGNFSVVYETCFVGKNTCEYYGGAKTSDDYKCYPSKLSIIDNKLYYGNVIININDLSNPYIEKTLLSVVDYNATNYYLSNISSFSDGKYVIALYRDRTADEKNNKIKIMDTENDKVVKEFEIMGEISYITPIFSKDLTKMYMLYRRDNTPAVYEYNLSNMPDIKLNKIYNFSEVPLLTAQLRKDFKPFSKIYNGVIDDNEFYIVDASSGTSAVSLSRYKTELPIISFVRSMNFTDVSIDGTKAVLDDRYLADISGNEVKYLSKLPVYSRTMFIVNKKIFAQNGSNLDVIDITDPYNPTIKNTLSIGMNDASKLWITPDRSKIVVDMRDSSGGYKIVDTELEDVTNYFVENGLLEYVTDKYAYFTYSNDDNGVIEYYVKRVSLSDPSNTETFSLSTLETGTIFISPDDEVLYLNDGKCSYDLENKKLVYCINEKIPYANEIYYYPEINKILMLKDSEMRIINVDNFHLHYIGTQFTGFDFLRKCITVVDNKLYCNISTNYDGAVVFDVSKLKDLK